MFSMIQDMPYAVAMIKGNAMYPSICGTVYFYEVYGGMAFSAFYTNRFYPEDIVGKVVIIHAMPDDFKTQPSGNSGNIIACGVIEEKDA